MTTDFDYSDPPDVLLDKGYAESKTNIPGAENKAINSFNYVLELKDITVQTRARAFQLLGCSYYKVGNYYAAIKAFDGSIQHDSNNIFAYIMKGRAFQATHQIISAQKAFSDAIEKAQALTEIQQKKGTYSSLRLYLDALLEIGITVSKRGEDECAIEYFDQAIEFYNKYDRSKPDSDDEKKAYERCIDIHYDIRISKSVSLNKLGMDSAKDQIVKIIAELDPLRTDAGRKRRLVSAYNVLGEIYVDNDPLNPLAMSTANTAIDLANEPSDKVPVRYISRAYLNKGLLLKKLRKFDDAIKCLTEGITKSEDLQPDGLASDLVYARGITYIEMQKFDEGIKDLRLLQRFDPRYALIDIALAEAYHRKAMFDTELEFQQNLLEKFTATVGKTEKNLEQLSDNMNDSLKGVEYLFYFLFFAGMGIFLFAFVWTFLFGFLNGSTGKTDPIIPAIGLIGGIDVILSMMLFSPAKIQKNRIDYSQWLMGYYNWLNTQFIVGLIISERLTKIHSPTNNDEEKFDWGFAGPIYTFLHTMTKEMLETIDKCCEFPDVQYSLGKKTDSAGNTDTIKKSDKETPADSGAADKLLPASSSNQGAGTGSEGSGKDIKNITVEKPASPATSAETQRLPQGFTFISTGEKIVPGHILTGNGSTKGIPAAVINCWTGAATDNRYVSSVDLESGKAFYSGKKPEPLDTITVDEFLHDFNILFAIKGYRSAIIQTGIQFLFLDEKREYSIIPDSSSYIKAKDPSGNEFYFIEYFEEKPKTQQVYGELNNQIFIDYVALPQGHPISKAIGKHYIIFRIAEIIPGQSDYVLKDNVIKPREPEWLWESDPFEFKVVQTQS